MKPPRRRRGRCTPARILLLVACMACAGGRAGAPTAADRFKADQRLREARRLEQKGEVAQACAAFEESERLNPVIGTLVELASCHAHEGKLATARSEFRRALEAAQRQ